MKKIANQPLTKEVRAAVKERQEVTGKSMVKKTISKDGKRTHVTLGHKSKTSWHANSMNHDIINCLLVVPHVQLRIDDGSTLALNHLGCPALAKQPKDWDEGYEIFGCISMAIWP